MPVITIFPLAIFEKCTTQRLSTLGVYRKAVRPEFRFRPIRLRQTTLPPYIRAYHFGW